MNVEILRYPKDEDWLFVKNNALQTMGKESEILPTSEWKTKILVSEHSPIRDLVYSWRWIDIPYWCSVHLVRHKIGIEHFVTSQRNDRQNNYDRNAARQDRPVTHRCTANAQAIMNISLKRTCFNASLETRNAWNMFLYELSDCSPELFALCVQPCIYRNGICPEFKKCGYNKSQAFDKKLSVYRERTDMS